MIENFHIACKAIDPKLEEIGGNLTAKYIKKCMAMFNFHRL